ncbi:hypothetical protein OROHE_020032 [Orobanche hederae]
MGDRFPIIKPSLNPNKHLKEQFVSNLNGCSMFEMFVLTSMLSVAILIRRCVGFHGRIDNDSTSLKKNDDAIVATKKWTDYMLTTAVDFIFVVFPLIIFPTVLADWTYINAVILLTVLLICFTCRRYSSSGHPESVQPLRTYLSTYRVTMMLVTCFCILAVDFDIFPRRYAKTETYGTSVMDLGVGAYVLANSLVSRQARGIMRRSLRNAMQSTSPLLFLGFARIVFTSGVNYQVHVGEYGVHWNFFFTLAAVSILTSVVNVPPKYCGILGSLVLIAYQYCLVHGLNLYLLSEERASDIISQNKEGIYSIFGYWGLYLVGVQLGSYLFHGSHPSSRSANKWSRTRVWFLTILFWLLTVFLDRYIEKPSRRMFIAMAMLADYIPGPKISILEEAFNRNLLGTFLLANLMTGLVNMSIDTIYVSAAPALIILSTYASVLSAAVVVADLYGVKLKFWFSAFVAFAYQAEACCMLLGSLASGNRRQLSGDMTSFNYALPPLDRNI